VSTPRNLDIGTWDPAERPRAPTRRSAKQAWSSVVLGITGTLLIHLPFVPSFLLGVSRTPARVQPKLMGSTGDQSSSHELVLLSLPPSHSVAEFPIAVSLHFDQVRPSPALVEIPQLDVPELETQSASETDPTSDRNRMAGIYSGQIRARIERIWRRPRTPVTEAVEADDRQAATEEYFHCQVRIVQDARGLVQETQLLSCNGTVPWQQSLVRAINQASPLPAPPDPKVFAQAITLDFVGYELAPGAPTDEYEIVSSAALH
jgi:hypothetical protein